MHHIAFIYAWHIYFIFHIWYLWFPCDHLFIIDEKSLGDISANTKEDIYCLLYAIQPIETVDGFHWNENFLILMKFFFTSCTENCQMKRKCCHFHEIFITGFTESYHFDNFWCSQWWKFNQKGARQNGGIHRYGTSIFLDIIVSVSKSIYDEKQIFWWL